MNDFMGQKLQEGDWVILNEGKYTNLQLGKIIGFYTGKENKVIYRQYYKTVNDKFKLNVYYRSIRINPNKVVKYTGVIDLHDN